MEFCDRALHVDDKCVKALSRRASAFVKLSGICSEVEAVTAAAVAASLSTFSSRGSNNETGVVEDGARGSTSTGVTDDACDIEKVLATEDGGGNNDGGEGAFYERFGGRDGLMALGLVDLDTAAEIDPDGEDIKRQRDGLAREIEEEKVRIMR